jgi:hypothetical protein
MMNSSGDSRQDRSHAQVGDRPLPLRGGPSRVIYLHGFASSAQGIKARFFASQFDQNPHTRFVALELAPTPDDFRFMTFTGLIDRLRQYRMEQPAQHVSLVGSSMGGLVALNYAFRYGDVKRMLLLAPALYYRAGNASQDELEMWKQAGDAPIEHAAFGRTVPLAYGFHQDGQRYLEPVPPAAPTLIIHGRDDDVVPISDSRAYAARYSQVTLVEVEGGHSLNDQLLFIWDQIRSFLVDQ